ncbi:MAG: hypothetical protein HC880_08210 [Bacteroidia bacterium]|nr:hypothetical protein [Bacteroidia bacterium]
MGSYIIEKQLSPTGAYFSNLSNGAKNLEDKTKPLVDMIVGWLDNVKCSGDMENFYDQIEGLEAGLNGCFVGIGSNFGPPDPLPGTCSRPPDNQLAAYFLNLDAYYRTRGLVYGVPPDSLPPFFEGDHSIEVRRYYEIILNTPNCVGFRIPLSFDQVINPEKVDTLIAQDAKVNPFVGLDKGLEAVGNESLSGTQFFPDLEGYAYGFFWDCTPETDAELITAITGPLAARIKEDLGSDALSTIRTKFMQYFINIPDNSFLSANIINDTTSVAEYLNVTSVNHLIDKLIFIHYHYLYPYMQGWRTPGTFNLMVHHMLTDKYKTDGFTLDNQADAARIVVYEGPQRRFNDCGSQMKLAGGVLPVIPTANATTSVEQPQYYAQDLLTCWVNQLAYIKNTVGQCPNDQDQLEISDGNPPYKVSDKVDEEKGDDGTFHDKHFDDNIRLNWFLRIFVSKKKIRKMSQRARNMQIDPKDKGAREGDDETEYIPATFQFHAVAEFLNCTGYKFAKILTPSQPNPHSSDINPQVSDYEAAHTTDHSRASYAGQDRGYDPDSTWEAQFRQGTNSNSTLFKYIYDPVYAFKYFYYKNEAPQNPDTLSDYRRLELNTCYRDYNPDKDCNFCGLGIIICEQTAQSWSAGQRYSFYDLYRTYVPPTIIVPPTLKAQDLLSPGYVDLDDNFRKVFIPWDENIGKTYDSTQYLALIDSSFQENGSRLKSQVELEIEKLNQQVSLVCGSPERRNALKTEFLRLLAENCYTVVKCTIDSIDTRVSNTSTDNSTIILETDIDRLIDQMVATCIERGQVWSFRIYESSCKYPHNLSQTSNVPSVEYGVVDSDADQYSHPGNPNPYRTPFYYRSGITATTYTELTNPSIHLPL